MAHTSPQQPNISVLPLKHAAFVREAAKGAGEHPVPAACMGHIVRSSQFIRSDAEASVLWKRQSKRAGAQEKPAVLGSALLLHCVVAALRGPATGLGVGAASGAPQAAGMLLPQATLQSQSHLSCHPEKLPRVLSINLSVIVMQLSSSHELTQGEGS